MTRFTLLAVLALLGALPAQAAEPPADIPIYAASLVGTPYRLGGISPATGLDCSGFVGHVFRQIAGVQLPRESLAISDASLPLDAAELRPGDLVFFNTLNRVFSHVGIYLGNDRFVHAASSRSGAVMVSNLTDRYWRDRFDGGRRVPMPDRAQAIDVAAFD